MNSQDFQRLQEAYSQVYQVDETKLVYGGEKKEPEDTRKLVTAADKKANTPAYQRFKAGDKGYKAAPHLGEAKVDKQLPEHERSAARLKRYDNPSGALALGGGQQRARRAEHEERRGVKTEEVEIAAQYFCEMGLNEYGVDILVEELGVEEFAEFVYNIAEEYVLTEARAGGARIEPVTTKGQKFKSGKPTGKSLERLRAQKTARKESEAKASEAKPSGLKASLQRQSAIASAKQQQPKKKGVLDRVAGAVLKGIDRHNKAMGELKKMGAATSVTAGKVKKAAGEFKKGFTSEEVELDEVMNPTKQSSLRKSLGKYQGKYESPKEFRKTEIEDAPYKIKGTYNAHLKKEEVELDEERAARRRKPSKSHAEVKAEIHAKNPTEIGFTGGAIPKKNRTPAKEHEFLKKRRANLGTNVGGLQYSSGAKYSGARTFEEVELGEGAAEAVVKAADWVRKGPGRHADAVAKHQEKQRQKKIPYAALHAEEAEYIDEKKVGPDEKLPSGKTPVEKMERAQGKHGANYMLSKGDVRYPGAKNAHFERGTKVKKIKDIVKSGGDPRNDPSAGPGNDYDARKIGRPQKPMTGKKRRRDETDRERSNYTPGGLRADRTKAGGYRTLVRKEEFEGDLFDYLLEYLVAEGYAETNEAAIAIMANMGEEWRQSIIEGKSDRPLGLMHPFARGMKQKKGEKSEEKYSQDSEGNLTGKYSQMQKSKREG